jgi:hypothetical protein
MSNEATSMYSTWFSVFPRGYCDRNFLAGCASGLYLRGADKDECCEDTPLEGVFEFELGSEVRSVSIMGGLGDLDGLECRDITEGDLEDGNEDSDVLRCATLPLELRLAVFVVVGGRWTCIAITLLYYILRELDPRCK